MKYVATGLGPRALALPMFHALTGCDTVSSFVGHGKMAPWTTWNVRPELTDKLLMLSCAPNDIPEDALYWETCHLALWQDHQVHRHWQGLMKALHKEDQGETEPTNEGCSRTACEKGNLPGRSHMGPNPTLPSPNSWDWTQTNDGLYEPKRTALPEVSDACYELVSCQCKMGGVRRCKCKKAALECTALSMCGEGC